VGFVVRSGRRRRWRHELARSSPSKRLDVGPAQAPPFPLPGRTLTCRSYGTGPGWKTTRKKGLTSRIPPQPPPGAGPGFIVFLSPWVWARCWRSWPCLFNLRWVSARRARGPGPRVGTGGLGRSRRGPAPADPDHARLMISVSARSRSGDQNPPGLTRFARSVLLYIAAAHRATPPPPALFSLFPGSPFLIFSPGRWPAGWAETGTVQATSVTDHRQSYGACPSFFHRFLSRLGGPTTGSVGFRGPPGSRPTQG